MIKDTFTRKPANICQETIVDILREEAALAGSKGHKSMPLPLIELAAKHGKGLVVDPEKLIRFHALDCWNSVGNKLAATPVARSDEARFLEGSLAAAGCGVYVDSFFDVVLDNWDELGSYTYTFRALADIVEMGVGWPDDHVSRTELECCLNEIIGALDE